MLEAELVEDVTLGFHRHPRLEALTVDSFEHGEPYMMTEIGSCTALRELFLSNNTSIPGAAIQTALAPLTSLEYIGFQNCPNLTDAAVSTIVRNNAKLEEIYLDSTGALTDASLEAICDHCTTALTHVCLHGLANISSEATKKLRDKLPVDGLHVAAEGQHPVSSSAGGVTIDEATEPEGISMEELLWQH